MEFQRLSFIVSVLILAGIFFIALLRQLLIPASKVQLGDRCMLRPWPAVVFQTCSAG
jgi:hypothetical protein